jgi:hypothetical protein
MLILFGSCASGTGHAHSDIDLAIQAAAGTDLSKLHLIQELESIFDNQQIDLTVITKNTDPLLLFEIFSIGRLLFESVDGLPGSYRAAFLRLGEIGIIKDEISQNLALGAGLRNILVHDYEEIDYKVLHKSIPAIIRDISQFMDAVISKT